jgi:hypothetical protein
MFSRVQVPKPNIIHYFANKATTTGVLKDRKPEHQRPVFMSEKLDELGAQFEQLPHLFCTRNESIERDHDNSALITNDGATLCK